MLLAVFLAGLLAQPAETQGELLGARGAIRELTSKNGESAILEKEAVFVDEIRAYVEDSPRMPAAKAAAEWLALIEKGRALPRRPLHNGANRTPIGSFSTLFSALPCPDVWPEIERIVAARPPTRRNRNLQLLMARLRGDDREVLRIARELSAPLPGEKPDALQPFQTEFYKTIFAALVRTHDVKAQVDLLESQVSRPRGFQDADLPDLSLLPPTEVEPTLVRLFGNARSAIYILNPADRRRAMEAVTKNLSRIKRPPWSLARDQRDAAFVRTLVAHYGSAELTKEDEASGAAGIYIADLLARGDVARAVAVLTAMKSTPEIGEPLRYFNFPIYRREARPRLLARVASGLEALIDRVPQRDRWELYSQSAIVRRQSPAAIKRLNAALASSKTPQAQKPWLLAYRSLQHAALGDLQAVANDYRASAKIARTPEDLDLSDSLLELGLAVGDNKLIDEGIAHELAGPYAERDPSLLEALLQRKRVREAESLQNRFLKKAAAGRNAGLDEYGYRLCQIYFAANRPGDVVAMIREFPYWSKPDLGELLEYSDRMSIADPEEAPTPLGYYAAWAFAKTDQKQLAAKILMALLVRANYYDEAYALLNELNPPGMAQFYTGLERSDPSQPRALIWHGEWLNKQGKRAEAVTLIRKGIALDPSDSMGRPGKKHKAYELLRDALSAGNDRAGAAECQRRVDGARLEESGDRLSEVGLLPQAIAAYDASLQKWPHDYSVHEKLALCLDASGRFDLATPHHRRAFELMPRCVGPVTKIVDALDPMFGDPDILAIGSPILARIDPNASASAAYVRAYYENEIGSRRAAVEHLRIATRRAPEFLQAWQLLAGLGRKGLLSQAEAVEASGRLLDLHPRLQIGIGYHFESISDLATMYRAIESARSRLPTASPGALVPLRSPESSATAWLPWLAYFASAESPPASYLVHADDISEIVGKDRFMLEEVP